jgi:hypothetical protein
MVLNMAQTWHQVRPGEIRNNCGGCHAHSQKPTEFKDTAAARADYVPFDLTRQVPLLTSKKGDRSGKRWDAENETGLRYTSGGVVNVEFFRDIKPILNRSCTACHTRTWEKPAGNLVLDDDTPIRTDEAGEVPNSYYRLAIHRRTIGQPNTFGHRPPRGDSWGVDQPTRYLWKLQSRRSLLVWKLFGRRLDGFRDDEFTTEGVPGDPTTLQHKGRTVDVKTWKYRDDPKKEAPRFSVGYSGSIMPPPRAVAGTYPGPDGKSLKVAPLSDEDRRTIVRWIDLGCPIDLDYQPAHPERRGQGFACDDQRPTLVLSHPRAGSNDSLTRVLVGMHDYNSGLDMDSFQVIADFPVDGVPPGENLAPRFKALTDSRWELRVGKPIDRVAKGKLSVSIKDRQGNVSRIERIFSLGK